MLQHTEDAEDITQEVFTEVFHSVKNFKGESKLSTWVYRITITKCLDFQRKKNRKKRFGFMQNLFGEESNEPLRDIPHFYHPGVQLENKERAAILWLAIDRLPERQRTAFILSKTEDLSYTEIAGVMDISLASVESLLVRAKQNLQGHLREYYKKPKNQAQVLKQINI
ncbi:MAG: polymerase subunit sigma-70 [Bacteroidetes bacterium]|nr:polymerase subunit sigma-70 [Bacteroidota bacterium]